MTSWDFSPSTDLRTIAARHTDKTLRLWHNRRPEQWYGVFWLPEFWLTVVLGVGLLWSLWRDRTAMRGAA